MNAMQCRPESGPMKFGEDWTGVFLRGDYAGPMAMTLNRLLKTVERGEKPSALDLVVLHGFATQLAGSDERNEEADVQLLLSYDECVLARPTIVGPPPKE